MKIVAAVGWAIVVLASAARAAGAAPKETWASWSASPVPVDAAGLTPLEREVLARCGRGEAGLVDTARVLLAAKLRGEALPELDAIASAQRAAGEPHPWARAWAATAKPLDLRQIFPALDRWLASPRADPRLRRCGVASGARADRTQVLVVVTVDALADLTPLPVRVRTGQWLTVEARMRVAAHGGRMLVLGPSGLPRTLIGSFDGRTLRGRFAPDGPGAFDVQVVADLPDGPRPVLEARLFADVDPSAQNVRSVAPGEDRADAAASIDDALAAMVNGARLTAGLPPFVRDPRLDAVAREHAIRMARARELAHDVGDGDPVERLRAAGIDAPDAGENVAHAPDVRLAHRAIWASASHRVNLLRRQFDRIGVAAVQGERGDVWVVEVFTGSLGAVP